MNDFDWTGIKLANEARARMAAKVANGWTPDATSANHADCDHAYDYCANTLDNRFMQGVTK